MTLICTTAGCTDRPAPERPVVDAYGRCPRHEANPWAGQLICHQCRSANWTMPWGDLAPGLWRCVSCHLTIVNPDDNRRRAA